MKKAIKPIKKKKQCLLKVNKKLDDLKIIIAKLLLKTKEETT